MTALAKYNTDASIEERRKANFISDTDEVWNILTLAQKVALNKLWLSLSVYACVRWYLLSHCYL